MSCPWCGKEIHNGNIVWGGGGQQFCSRKCKEAYEAAERERKARERNEAIERKRREEEEYANLGFLGRLFRLIKRIIITGIVLIIGFYIIKNADNNKKSESYQKTEQTTTQPAKKQSTTSAKNTSGSKTTASSKPASSKSTTTSSLKPATTQSSNTQAISISTQKSSSSVPASTAASNATTNNSSAESDEYYQTYLALMTLLADEGESLKLCEAQNKTKGKEANVIGKMSQLRGTKYYNDALNDLLGYCPKYADEYYKNGKYFASEAEFYQAYIAPDYSKTLKAKKKGNK